MDTLRIQRGNDFCLRIAATLIQGGAEFPFDFGEIEDKAINIMRPGQTISLTGEINADGDLLVYVPADLPCSLYGLELTGRYQEKSWRYCIRGCFRIVDSEEESNVFDSETADADIYDIGIRIGPSALTFTDMMDYIDRRFTVVGIDDFDETSLEENVLYIVTKQKS